MVAALFLFLCLGTAVALATWQLSRARPGKERRLAVLTFAFATLFLGGFVLFAGCGGNDVECGKGPTIWLILMGVLLLAIALAAILPASRR